MGEMLVLILSSAISIIVGFFVFLQAVGKTENRLFGLLALSFTGLIISNYFSLRSEDALLFIRLVIFFTTLVGTLLLVMIYTMGSWRASAYLKSFFWLLFAATVVIDVTPLGFQSVSHSTGESGVQPNVGIGIWLFAFYFIATVSSAIFLLFRAKAKSYNKSQRRRFSLIQLGSLPAIVLAPITSFILPVMLKDTRFIAVTPLYVIFFLIMIGYAIIRHGLFDIKSAAIRTLAYLLSITTMASAYFAFAYIASVTLFKENVTTGLSMSPVNIILALILAFIFQPIKQFFDRITNRIFYRDQYDTNVLLSRIGQVLTSTTKLHEVMQRSAHEIETTLKANGSMFIVYRDHHPDAVVMTKLKNNFGEAEYSLIHDMASTVGKGVLLVSSLEGSHTHVAQRLHTLLAKRNVALVLPLVTTNEIIGYLLLGEQLAGNYTKRDIEVLETLADSLVIAVQNARSVQVVRDLNTHLEQRVSAATRELRATNKRLIELDATKDEFVSMASHQLRTPLTSIKGYLSMVLEGDVGDITPDQRQLLGEAFTSSERMVHLIGDFLNVSRLQTGKFMIEYRETDLAKLVEQEVESMRQIAGSHDKKIVYRVPQVFPRLFIDDNKLRQVVMNFIDNAIYYSPDSRAPITVRLVVEDGFAVMTVTDKGMGVPAEVQKQLFTKFFRAENARKQRPDGTGIGLYLARRIIDSHGGKLIFESVEGKGSTFGFRLPIKRLSQPPQLAE